jgi:hypothetical protein
VLKVIDSGEVEGDWRFLRCCCCCCCCNFRRRDSEDIFSCLFIVIATTTLSLGILSWDATSSCIVFCVTSIHIAFASRSIYSAVTSCIVHNDDVNDGPTTTLLLFGAGEVRALVLSLDGSSVILPVFNDDDAYVGDVVVGISGIITMIGLIDGLRVGFMVDGGGVVTIAVMGGGVDPIVGGCV